jgi:hypothetical protein
MSRSTLFRCFPDKVTVFLAPEVDLLTGFSLT